ncbi:hypothetical protein D6850_16870 [Roseovarius spongiae]|uniref:Maltokinase n=1 Tax=Roseovarius spongiae TaxID=2320272 RepID=A0A3A8B7E6_9RHOB|nr:putative maltokinase [Roseovarius spongiae]RKF12633.1 hypothetical protein D6850_16870 [Roseovarius spongiae]
MNGPGITEDSALCRALSGEAGRAFARDVLPGYLPAQRWFGAKEARIGDVDLTSFCAMDEGDAALCIADVALPGGAQRYFLPLTARTDDAARHRIGRLPDGPALFDGAADMTLARGLLQAMRDGQTVMGPQGGVRFEGEGIPPAAQMDTPTPLAAEQSNVSIAFGRQVVLKVYRRLRAGPQPDVEVSRHLTRAARFAHAPAWLGSATLEPKDGEATTLAAAFAYAPNRGDAWSHFTSRLDAVVARRAGPADLAEDAALCRLLGQRTGGLHRALAAETADHAFAPVPVTRADLAAWTAEALADIDDALGMIAPVARTPGALAAVAGDVMARGPVLKARIERVASAAPSGLRTRIHGDYHLGQVLVTPDDDFAIIDFEGEPRRDLAARRAKMSPLRDVAGMLRSIDYAARSAVLRAAQSGADPADAAARADDWHAAASRAFMAGYRDEMAGCAAAPEAALETALLELFLLQKAVYEVSYELSNRPDWAVVPMAGVLKLADAMSAP